MTLQTGQTFKPDARTVRDDDGREFVVAQEGVAGSLVSTASVTSPGAATIASINAAPPGVYRVSVLMSLTGTAETNLANLRLRMNGATVGVLPSLQGSNQLLFPRVAITAGNLTVDTGATAVVGSVYTVTIIATRVE